MQTAAYSTPRIPFAGAFREFMRSCGGKACSPGDIAWTRMRIYRQGRAKRSIACAASIRTWPMMTSYGSIYKSSWRNQRKSASSAPPETKTRRPEPARLLLCLRTNQLFLAARFVAVFFAVDLLEAVFEAVLPPAAFREEGFFAPP